MMQPIQLCFDGSGTYKTAFSLGNMGTQALKSHATGKGNFEKVKEQKEVCNFFTKRHHPNQVKKRKM